MTEHLTTIAEAQRGLHPALQAAAEGEFVPLALRTHDAPATRLAAPGVASEEAHRDRATQMLVALGQRPRKPPLLTVQGPPQKLQVACTPPRETVVVVGRGRPWVPHIKMGRKRVFPRKDLDTFMEAHRAHAPGGAS